MPGLFGKNLDAEEESRFIEQKLWRLFSGQEVRKTIFDWCRQGYRIISVYYAGKVAA
jgi:hypothetical protein